MRLRNGFTLIELLVTLAIIAILASAAMPLAELSAQRSKEHELKRALREIRMAIDDYKRASDENRIARGPDASGYPPSLAALAEGTPLVQSPEKKKIYFLRRLPRDPFATDPNVPAEETWGLRSHDSPPDEPKAGDDVFDVYSLNEGTGLNGVPYRKW